MERMYMSKFGYYLPKVSVWTERKIVSTCAYGHPIRNANGIIPGSVHYCKHHHGKATQLHCAVCRAIHTEAVKRTVFSWYGGKCVCCGESYIDFLTLDHINDDGFKQRQKTVNGRRIMEGGAGTMFYQKLLRKGKDSRPSDLQILCGNCQLGKKIGKGFCVGHSAKDLRIASKIKTVEVLD